MIRIAYTPDPRIENCGVFRLEREDHTTGNLLRMQLLKDPDVLFAAYKHPHPIQHHIELRVQTAIVTKSGKQKYMPPDAVRTALTDLTSEFSRLQEQLRGIRMNPANRDMR